jgi:hypothetical protein
MKTHENLAVAVMLGFAILIAPPVRADQMLHLNTFVPTDTIAACKVNLGGDHGKTFGSAVGYECTSTALQPVLADQDSTFLVGNFDGTAPTTQTFRTAFNNWNTTNGAAAGGKTAPWVIALNSADLNVTFNVTDVATAELGRGGINPFAISFTMNPGYVGPPKTQLVWTQAIYSSYDSKGSVDLDPPLNTLDTISLNPLKGVPCLPLPGPSSSAHNSAPSTIPPGKPYCGPIYPFQLPDKVFGDSPRGPWPDESFRAITLLSTVTYDTNQFGDVDLRELTLYNGVEWGFDLSATPATPPGAPEPPSLLLLGSSILGVGRLLRKRLLNCT